MVSLPLVEGMFDGRSAARPGRRREYASTRLHLLAERGGIMKDSSIRARALPFVTLLAAGCLSTTEGAFMVAPSSDQIVMTPTTSLKIERSDYPLPPGMDPVTLYVGDVEVLASQAALTQVGIGRKELARQLEDNLITALTRFDQVAGVVQGENVPASAVGRRAPIRVSAALMDLSFKPDNKGDKTESSTTSTEKVDPQTLQRKGAVECRVRLSFELRTDSGLMEFAAPQAYGRDKVTFTVGQDAEETTEPSTLVEKSVPDVVLLGLLGATVQAIPQIEQLYANEIDAARRAAK